MVTLKIWASRQTVDDFSITFDVYSQKNSCRLPTLYTVRGEKPVEFL